MAGCGQSTRTPTGPWSRVSMAGNMTHPSLSVLWSPSWTWCVTCIGGPPPPQPCSMSEVWLGILCLDRLRTGQCYHYTLTSFLSSKNHEILLRYGRRFAFFVMLFMAISLSVAIAFSPNYIVYTILRYTFYYKKCLHYSNFYTLEQLTDSHSQHSSKFRSFSVST